MIKALQNIKNVYNDERLSVMLYSLSNHGEIDFNLQEPKAPSGEDKISLRDIDFYSRKSFPPCMKSLYSALKN